jgi:hypothetical protein
MPTVRFFPHQTTDLTLLLSLFSREETLGEASWHTRYVLLLWLSLVVMLPFKLDEAVPNIKDIGGRYLKAAGKERDAASIVLARLFSRYGLFRLSDDLF